MMFATMSVNHAVVADLGAMALHAGRSATEMVLRGFTTGDPLEDITLLEPAETSMVVIMKAGEVVKNILPATR